MTIDFETPTVEATYGSLAEALALVEARATPSKSHPLFLCENEGRLLGVSVYATGPTTAHVRVETRIAEGLDATDDLVRRLARITYYLPFGRIAIDEDGAVSLCHELVGPTVYAPEIASILGSVAVSAAGIAEMLAEDE